MNSPGKSVIDFRTLTRALSRANRVSSAKVGFNSEKIAEETDEEERIAEARETNSHLRQLVKEAARKSSFYHSTQRSVCSSEVASSLHISVMYSNAAAEAMMGDGGLIRKTGVGHTKQRDRGDKGGEKGRQNETASGKGKNKGRATKEGKDSKKKVQWMSCFRCSNIPGKVHRDGETRNMHSVGFVQTRDKFALQTCLLCEECPLCDPPVAGALFAQRNNRTKPGCIPSETKPCSFCKGSGKYFPVTANGMAVNSRRMYVRSLGTYGFSKLNPSPLTCVRCDGRGMEMCERSREMKKKIEVGLYRLRQIVAR